MYVIVVEPLATPVTIPDELTVATPVLDDDHGVDKLGEFVAERVDVPPIQEVKVPEITGNGFTFTVWFTNVIQLVTEVITHS